MVDLGRRRSGATNEYLNYDEDFLELDIQATSRFATYRLDPRPNADYKPVESAQPRVHQDERLLKSLGALYRFGDGWQVWGHYGEGFKMPTAQQLYTSVPGAFFDVIPAPDLQPESVKSIEVGLHRETARLCRRHPVPRRLRQLHPKPVEHPRHRQLSLAQPGRDAYLGAGGRDRL